MVLHLDFNYAVTDEIRKLHIYLPDDYDNSNERYPVMYMFDGQNIFEDQYAAFGKGWGFDKYLDTWDKKIIMVGLTCPNNASQRANEYVPYSVLGYYKEQINSYTDELYKWIINVVKPYIDETYRTIPFRECTGIGGSSYGGIAALFGVMKYNIYFSKCIAISPSITTIKEVFIPELILSEINPDTKTFLSYGTKEVSSKKFSAIMGENIHLVENIFKQKNASTKLFVQEGGKHNEASWEKQIPLCLPFLWQNKF